MCLAVLTNDTAHECNRQTDEQTDVQRDTVTIACRTYMQCRDRAIIGSRSSDNYFHSVCWFVCAEFLSAVFDPISIKLGHMLYVWV